MFKHSIPALIWACIILVFCGYPGSGLPHVSFHFILPLDKWVHIFLFGTLCLLIHYSLKKGGGQGLCCRHPLFSAFLLSSLYGIWIEFMQKYVFVGRSFEGMDIVADASGALLVVLYIKLKIHKILFPDTGINEIVFERKNKRYGAYALRLQYNKNVVKALLWSVLLVGLVFFIPFFTGMLEKEIIKDESIEVNVMQLLEAPDMDVPNVAVEIKKIPGEATKPVVVEAVKEETPPAPKQEVIENPNAKLAEFLMNKKDSLQNEKDSLSQEKEQAIGKETPLKMYVDALPAFPGGEEAFYTFLKRNMKYPALAKKNGITGTVFVSFMVEADGRGDNIKIVAGLGGGCNDEALRVLALMPSWIPGKRHGSNTPFLLTLPLEFALR